MLPHPGPPGTFPMCIQRVSLTAEVAPTPSTITLHSYIANCKQYSFPKCWPTPYRAPWCPPYSLMPDYIFPLHMYLLDRNTVFVKMYFYSSKSLCRHLGHSVTQFYLLRCMFLSLIIALIRCLVMSSHFTLQHNVPTKYNGQIKGLTKIKFQQILLQKQNYDVKSPITWLKSRVQGDPPSAPITMRVDNI